MSKLLYQICEKPFGFTYNQWSIEWWKWILSIPKEKNPIFDNIGKYADINQKYPYVVFLCQTLNAVNNIPFRNIIVKEGMNIFMPIINWISMIPDDGTTDEELISVAKQKIDVVQDTTLWFNDVKLTNMGCRARTPAFYVYLPKNNILDKEEGFIKIASDGYWIFTTPILKPIFLKTYGSCSKGITRISVNYTINLK